METNREEYLNSNGIQSYSIGYIPTSQEFAVHIKTLQGSKVGQTFRKAPTPWPSFLIISETIIENTQKGTLLKLSTTPTSGFNFEIDPNTPSIDGNLQGITCTYQASLENLDGKDLIIGFAADLLTFKGNSQPKLYLPGIFRIPQTSRKT